MIEPGNEISKHAKDVSWASFNNCPAVKVITGGKHFRAPVRFNYQAHILRAMIDGKVSNFPQNDGDGRKPQFFTLIGTEEAFHGLGWEVIVMCAEDIDRVGGYPTVMMNQVDFQGVNKENIHLAKAMFDGYGDALKQAGLINITGETAIMGKTITAFCDTGDAGQLILTWNGSCLGLAPEDGRLLDGSGIKSVMPIVGLWEPAQRCNGNGFFIRLFLDLVGGDVKKLRQSQEVLNIARKLCVPSQSYSRTVTRLLGWTPDGRLGEPLAKIHGIAHITGGGLWEKLGDLLPPNVGAKLDKMPRPAEVLLECQKLSLEGRGGERLTDWKAHSILHGGCGKVMVCETEEDANTAVLEARKDGVDAYIIGETVSDPNKIITVNSRFLQGRTIYSNKPE